MNAPMPTRNASVDATSPPRKKARKGKKKSKAERLARGLTTSSAAVDGVSLDALQTLLDAPTSITSTAWDQAQAIAMRLNMTPAKQLMVRSLVFDKQAPKAAVHYAKRLQLHAQELVAVLAEGRLDSVRCLSVAKFLVDADVSLVSNDDRITEFIVPWLDLHKSDAPPKDEDDQAISQPQLPSAFLTATRLVLQPHATQTKPAVVEERLALQRQLVTRLLADDSPHSGAVLQYATALAPVLTTAGSIDAVSDAEASLKSDETADAEQTRRADVASRAEALLRMLWPDARVFAFGSSATRLLIPTDGSHVSSDDDVDLCAVLPSCPQFLEDTAPLVADVKDHLELYDAAVSDAVAVTRARVPIIRWTDPQSGLQCDLCVNNLPALWNTQLTVQLLEYTKNNAVREFSVWMKTWYKTHRARGFASGISSYGMQLLVLYFLQWHGILPANIDCGSLELTGEALHTLDVAQIQQSVKKAIEKARSVSAEVSTPLSLNLWSLVVAFFSFYGANGFDFEHQVVSLRDTALTKQAKQWTRRNWRYSLSIEDPVETQRDLGTLFSRVSLTRFRLSIVQACVKIAAAHEKGDTASSDGRQRVLDSLLIAVDSK